MWRGGGCYNERGQFAINYIADHHVWPMKARFLDAPALRSVTDNDTHPPLCVAVLRHMRLLSHQIVSYLVSVG